MFSKKCKYFYDEVKLTCTELENRHPNIKYSTLAIDVYKSSNMIITRTVQRQYLLRYFEWGVRGWGEVLPTAYFIHLNWTVCIMVGSQ